MIAIIGGSQSYRLLEQSDMRGERVKPVSTPYGDSPPLHRMQSDAGEFLFLSRHGESGYSVGAPFVNYRANIYALKELGVESIVAWSGPGALDDSYRPGELVVPHDVVDETRSRPSTFYAGTGLGFVRMRDVFCPRLRHALGDCTRSVSGEPAQSGVYVCTEGPRMETPAEVRKYRAYGGQLIGMTLCPEAFLARELEMCYAALCFVTNYAEGIQNRVEDPATVFGGLANDDERAAADAMAKRFPEIAAKLAASIPNDTTACVCGRAMERFRQRGVIGENWREWVRP